MFVISKLYDIDWGYQAATSAINKSLKSLDTDYIDLMLMHHPGSRQGRNETWQALEAAHKKVLVSFLVACRSKLLRVYSTCCGYAGANQPTVWVCRVSAKLLV